MTHLLIIVTFLAGNAFGPVVSTTPMPSLGACQAAQTAAAETIAQGLRTNVPGAVVERDGTKVVVVQNSGRVSAQLDCASLTPSPEKPK